MRFEITERPLGASYCHCTHRRQGPGSPLRPAGRFEKAFCTVCGPALFSRDRADHESVGARLGALDRNPGVRFTHRQYVSYAASWEPIPDDGLERYPEARTE